LFRQTETLKEYYELQTAIREQIHKMKTENPRIFQQTYLEGMVAAQDHLLKLFAKDPLHYCRSKISWTACQRFRQRNKSNSFTH
jgi:hypothetical protein